MPCVLTHYCYCVCTAMEALAQRQHRIAFIRSLGLRLRPLDTQALQDEIRAMETKHALLAKSVRRLAEKEAQLEARKKEMLADEGKMLEKLAVAEKEKDSHAPKYVLRVHGSLVRVSVSAREYFRVLSVCACVCAY